VYCPSRIPLLVEALDCCCRAIVVPEKRLTITLGSGYSFISEVAIFLCLFLCLFVQIDSARKVRDRLLCFQS